MSCAKHSRIVIEFNGSSNNEVRASESESREDKNALCRKKALSRKNDLVNQRASVEIVSNTGSCETIKTKETQKNEGVAFKKWDKHTVDEVIKFAMIYFKTRPKGKGNMSEAVLFVHNALSKQGINKSKEDIKNLLSNPSLPSSKKSPKPMSSDRKGESNCKRTENRPQQPVQPNTTNVKGEVSQKEVPNGEIDSKLSSSQKQKLSENQANTIAVLDGNQKNTVLSNSKTSKTDTQTTNIDENKIAIMNNTPGMISSKFCRQDDNALKSKQPQDTQPPEKGQRSGATDDGRAESNCSNIGETTLETSALEINIENFKGEITENKREETAKIEIPVEKTDKNTLKKEQKSENVNGSTNTERKNRNMRSSSKTDTGIMNVEIDKTNKCNVNYDVPKTDSSNTCKQDGKSLKLKQKHDTHLAVKRRRSCATELPCPQDGTDEFNCGNIGEKPQIAVLETNTENVNDKKCEEKAKEEIPVEKTYTDSIIATPKKQKKSEKEVNVNKIPERNKRNMRSSSSSDNSKSDSGILIIEDKKTGAINDVPKTGSPKTCKQDGKSLKLKLKHDIQPAVKSQQFCATDVACLQDGTDEFNCGNIGEKPQIAVLETNTENVNDKKCEEKAKEEIPVEKTYTDSIIATPKKQKKSEKEVNVNKIPERNKRNMRSSSSSDNSKSDSGILIIEDKKTGAINDVPKTGSPKTCKQDGKSLKLKLKHDIQPAVKSQQFCATDVACLQGAQNKTTSSKSDNKDESNCNFTENPHLQLSTLKSNTENVDIEVSEKKSDEPNKVGIPAEKSYIDKTIATPKKPKMSENEVGISKAPDRKKINSRTVSGSDSFENGRKTLNDEKDKTGENYDEPKTDSPKTCKQDEKSLKLKRKHDAQLAVKRRRTCATDVAHPQGDGLDESNGCNIGEKPQTTALETNTENVNGEVTDKECEEKVKEEIPVEKTCTDSITATPKKRKKSEKEVNVNQIPERNKRNTRSSSSLDNSKSDAGILIIEDNKTGGIKDMPKTGSPKTCKQDGKSLKLKQKHEIQPAVKRRRSCDKDVACLQENSTVAKDAVTVSEKEILIGPYITTESSKVIQTKYDKSIPLKKDVSDEFNEIKIDKTSKRPKMLNRSKRTRSTLNTKKSITYDDKICKNLNKESGTNEILKTNSSKIVVEADVHVPMEIKCTDKPSTPPQDSSHIDVDTKKEENIVNKSVADYSENHTQYDVQKPLQTRAGSSSSTMSCEDGTVTSETAKTEHIENKTDNKLVEPVSYKIHNQLSLQKPMQTRAAKKTSTAPSGNLTNSAETIQVDNSVKEENDESADSPKSNRRSEVESSAANQLSTQSSGVASANSVGGSTTAESIFQATTQSVSELDELNIKPEQVKQELLIKDKIEFDTAEIGPKRLPGPTRKAYLRERKKKYQAKKQDVRAPPETCLDSCTEEKPPHASATEESEERKAEHSTTVPVPQISTDYYASEKVEEGILGVSGDENFPFKKIKLQLPTPQAPPLCSFQDVIPILDAVSSSDSKDQPDPSPNVPAVQDVLPDAVCSSTLSQSSLSFTLTAEGTTETAPISETDTVPSSLGLGGFCTISPPLSPSMLYPDTPRSSKQTSDSPGDIQVNNPQISEDLLNKITVRVSERVTEQVSERVMEHVSRRMEEKMVQGFDDLKRFMLETLKPSAKNN